ncbi:hypothetical protein P6U16_01325 [Rhizobium sp. 32-5/1]|uniref:hypothetical protein n=1 Tax=Rhizobium sp. 32-5/1 TaxID=3019602 RepID=UPI00240E2AA4|nr:hypothetical protein [Rhizobium sp. 32-5/1]WEZ83527.1 hypothetical protein P6U16_01325 [Rhizobium sp. 32-5/1]
MGKYEGLTHRLQKEVLGEIVLSFADIEAISGVRLPGSAQLPQYWENPSKAEHILGMKKAVRSAGFRSFLLAGQDKVRFVRDG